MPLGWALITNSSAGPIYNKKGQNRVHRPMVFSRCALSGCPGRFPGAPNGSGPALKYRTECPVMLSRIRIQVPGFGLGFTVSGSGVRLGFRSSGSGLGFQVGIYGLGIRVLG